MSKSSTFNYYLHRVIQESGIRKNFLAESVGITPQKLSLIISGKKIPNQIEKTSISNFLKVEELDIFRDK